VDDVYETGCIGQWIEDEFIGQPFIKKDELVTGDLELFEPDDFDCFKWILYGILK